MAQILRPVGTVSIGYITLIGSTPAHNCVNEETVDTSTYIKASSYSNTGYANLTLPNFSRPVGGEAGELKVYFERDYSSGGIGLCKGEA